MKRRVLLADDSSTALAVATAFLESSGYQVVQARDGLEAIDLACTESPDVVVLDVEMPRMNGYHACRLLKMDRRTSHLPVIMLTSRDLPADRYWGLQTGADRYVTKEQPLGNVVRAMEELLEERESRVGEMHPAGGLLVGRDPIGLLSSLNEILDRKLYEATILGEVSRLAWSSTDPNRTAEGIMELLAKLFDFSLAAMLLVEGKSSGAELLWLVRSSVSDEALAADERLVLSALEEKCGVRADSRGLKRRKIVAPGSALSAALEPEDAPVVHAVPIGSRERGAGVFVVWGRGRAWRSTGPLEMVETLANAASVVLDHARLYQEMQRLATTDGLTGLANYRVFQESLERELDRSRRTDQPMAVVIMDLDNFKTINDSLGHREGDLVLKSVAAALKRGARQYDLVARYGGEEFAAVLPATGRDGALQAAERFRLLVRSVGGRMKIDALSLSLGVAVSSDVTDSADRLVRDADEALYRAKTAGKNRVCMSA